MADYQEYRRRILHRRWRRVFIIVALLALLALLGAIGILWKVLHRERVDTALSQNTILRQVTTDNTWNTVSYPLARQLRVQTLEDSTETDINRTVVLNCSLCSGHHFVVIGRVKDNHTRNCTHNTDIFKTLMSSTVFTC